MAYLIWHSICNHVPVGTIDVQRSMPRCTTAYHVFPMVFPKLEAARRKMGRGYSRVLLDGHDGDHGSALEVGFLLAMCLPCPSSLLPCLTCISTNQAVHSDRFCREGVRPVSALLERNIDVRFLSFDWLCSRILTALNPHILNRWVVCFQQSSKRCNSVALRSVS